MAYTNQETIRAALEPFVSDYQFVDMPIPSRFKTAGWDLRQNTVRRFVDAIADNVEMTPSFHEGLRNQRIIDVVVASAQQGKWLPVPQYSGAPSAHAWFSQNHRFLSTQRRPLLLTLQCTEDHFTYRDLNHNGQLDPFEDTRLPVETRITDLLARMTVAEKVGLMFQTFAAHVFDGGASLLEGDIS